MDHLEIRDITVINIKGKDLISLHLEEKATKYLILALSDAHSFFY